MLFPALVILLVSTLFITLYAHQIPQTRKLEKTLYLYTTRGVFDYNVTLTPGTLYEVSVLENPTRVFLKLVDKVVLNVTYVLSSQPQATNISNTLEVEVLLSHPQVWSKRINFDRVESRGSSASYSIVLDIPTMLSLAKNISSEVDVPASKYSITVNCNSKTKFMVLNQTASTIFPFSLQINIDLIGKVIEFSTREFTNTNVQKTAVTEEALVNLGSMTITVGRLRQISLASLAATSMGTASYAGLYIYRKIKKPKRDKVLEGIQRYRSLIVEAADALDSNPSFIIKVKSFNELVKTSRELFKPIIHVKSGKKHLLYVLDENTKYVFEHTEATETD